MALYSLLKLVALCALVHETAAFADLPPSEGKGGGLGATASKRWHVLYDFDYPDIPDTQKIELNVHPLGGYDGAFVEAAKRLAEIKGSNIMVVKDGPGTAYLKKSPDPENGAFIKDSNHRVYAYY